MQGSVTPGAVVTVEVGGAATSVEVSTGDGTVLSFPVLPGGNARVRVPNVPGGTLLTVACGTGLRARVVLVEVLAP
ncbi:MAG: hypothetical protein FJ265_17560 [Planctomycetes bacterium]|nr:hypothetical protein [Planctomycetota bacterium]